MNPSSAGRRRSAVLVVTTLTLAFGLLLLLPGCGVGTGVGDGGPADTATAGDVSTPNPTDEPGSTASSAPGSADEPGPTSGRDSTASSKPTGGTTDSTTGGATTTTTATSSTAGQQTININLYFVRDEKIAVAARTITKTQGVGAAAVRALLAGPSRGERSAGMTSTVPKGTTLLGLDIKNGVATVDLSKEYSSGGGSLSMMMRLAQVVFTLTQFPTVQGVEFKLDGRPIDVLGGEGVIIDHPMTRADYEDLSPAILVESPALGATVKSPLRATGSANVFEAVFRINVVDNEGLIIADQRVLATSGTGTRGRFDVTLGYPAGHKGRGWLIVFENSAKDGAPINVVEIPVALE